MALGALCALLAVELGLPLLFTFWRPRLPLVVYSTPLFGLLFTTRLRGPLAALTVLLGTAWLAVAFTPIASHLLQRATRIDPVAPADAIFVFASHIQLDGDPSPVAMARLQHGFELLTEQQAPCLVLSELPPPWNSHEKLARRWLPHWKTAGEILAVGPIANTHDEAVAVGKLFRERGWKRVLAVTSPAHSRRAAATLEHEGLEVISSPCTETRFDQEHLAHPGDRISAFGMALHDLLGYWIYGLRGWL